MKTKLFTQNSCFVLLMALVLVFGVQGVANAVTATAPADLVDITARQFETDIGSAAGATAGIEISSITLEDTAVPDGGTADDSNTGADRTNTIETITVSTSGIQLTAPTFGTSVTFSESTTTENQTTTRRPMPTSVTLTGYFTRVGKATLTIRYTDLSDRQANSSNQATESQTSAKTITHTYTYYVVKSDDAIPETTTFTLTRDGTSLSNGYITGLNGRTDFRIYNNNSGDYPVTYSVTGGSAALYFSDTPYATSDPAVTSTVSSSSGRKVWLNMNGADTFGNGATSVVTVNIGEATATPKSSHNVAYIIGTPKLDISLGPATGVTGVPDVTEVDNDDKNRYRFTGGTQGQNAGTITATVGDGGAALNTDGNGFSTGAVPAGVLVKFELRHKGSTTGSLSVDANTFTQVDAKNNSRAGTSLLDTGQTLYVRTNSSGAATVNYWFGTLGSQEITVSSVGVSKKVTAEIGASQTGTQISEDTNNQQTGNPQKFDLVALVEDADEEGIANEVVTFRTNNGELEPISARPSSLTPSGTDITLQGIVNVITNSSGKAHVVYDIGDNTGRQEIHASLSDGKSYTFVINGAASSGGGGGGSAAQQEARLRITATGTGTTREVTVDALTAAGTLVSAARLVTLSGTAVTGSPTVTTGTTETITVPSTPGVYRLTATDIGGTYESQTVVVTVAAPAANGTLSLQAIGAPTNLQQTVEVTATNAAGTDVEGVSVTLRGTGFATQTVTTGATGSIRAIVPIPSATSSHTLTAEATGYDADSIDLSATGQQPPTGGSSQPAPTGPAGVADSIEIDGDRQLSGTVNQALRLSTRVLDANDRGVSGVRVTFKVLAPGKGRLSQRGNGRAVQDETDRNGYASATLTPLGGDLIVEAKAARITAPVSFIISVNGASDTGTETDTREMPEDTTTPEPEAPLSMDVGLKVSASNRPVMYWIAAGALYRQATGDATQIAASAQDVVVDAVGGKLYYIQQTSERTGAVHRANLDGTNDEVVQKLTSAPQGLALDGVNKKLYLTNNWGKIQRMNLDGTGFETNFVTGLTGPMDITVSSGRVYWTESGGNVQFVNVSDPKDIRTIASDLGALSGIAADGRSVYWTEQTGARSGRIRASNLGGTGILTDLFTFGAVPMGLGIDASMGKLYWTNGWGKVQRERDRSKGRYEDVATGLMTSSVIAIGGANSETAEEAPKPTTPTTAKGSKYDVNGDGSVDSKDVDELLVAVLAELTHAKYDVNGDGAVDAKDVRDVNKNLDAGAAGAPTLLGRKFSALEIGRLQEQIDLLIATNDHSPAAMRTLVYLQQLIVMARPEKTQLLANYPNPFNPETWMPYELATDTDVRITIYNAQGVVIRTLQLGQQSAGYYTDRERAAYWDGRNTFGEQVASGVYFYQLETDEMSSLRKMVILK